MYKKIYLILILSLALHANSNHVEEKQVLEKSTYKSISFEKRIKYLRLSDNKTLSVEYLQNTKLPFSKIRVFAKKIGSVNLFVTFFDKTTKQIHFIITEDIRNIKLIIKNIDDGIEVEQVNNTIILKGSVKNNKVKEKVTRLLKESIPKAKIVDLLELVEPDKMVRLKLYVAEINNKKGLTIKNNWTLGYSNSDGTQTGSVATNMLSAVNLSGGITAIANNIGSKFSTSLTLNYLKSNGVAKILDETTLITLENKKAEFLAGGTLLIETSSTSAEGLPVSGITTVDYGLKLEINIVEIINDHYINLEIDTSSSALDPVNGVGELPAKTDKAIKTNVVIANGSTIVLGGLISNSNSKEFEKIPFFGDIPIIGELFKSKSFQDGESELIFFITPTIVNTAINNQGKKYQEFKEKIITKKKR
jgi:pilus assembly protein CpaC